MISCGVSNASPQRLVLLKGAATWVMAQSSDGGCCNVRRSDFCLTLRGVVGTLRASSALAEVPTAQVAELVDALVSGTSGVIRGGSSPLLGTIAMISRSQVGHATSLVERKYL
jgi:hypothetical protein